MFYSRNVAQGQPGMAHFNKVVTLPTQSGIKVA